MLYVVLAPPGPFLLYILLHLLFETAFSLMNYDMAHELIIIPSPMAGNPLSLVQCYPTGLHLEDAKLFEVGTGASDIRRMIIDNELFKED